MKALSCLLVVAMLLATTRSAAAAQTNDADAWRALAANLEPGSTVDVRLRDGKHFRATFIDARIDGVVVQRKTRVPVAVETLPYERIAAMSRTERSGMSAGKVTAIALGSAGAAIGALFLILLASLD